MNPEIIGVFIPIFLFGAIAVVLWKVFDDQNRQRMAMIEKGIKPSEFLSKKLDQPRPGDILNNLKWGLLFVFAGVGLLIGEQLQYYFGFHEESAIFGTMLITGGLALIIFYLIATKKMKNKQLDEQ
jgi:hypothetical protein